MARKKNENPDTVAPDTETVVIAIRLTKEEDKALRLAAIQRDYRQPTKFAKDLILAGLAG